MSAGYVRLAALPTSSLEPVNELETIADYALGGGPVSKGGSGGGGATPRVTREAPAVSSDGQVILYGNNRPFTSEQVLNLQAATRVPPSPQWATIVGRAYWLTAANIADLKTRMSISFNYLGREVPIGEEPGLTIYFWNGLTWSPIEETVRDISRNFVSAPSQGKGLYALMSSVNIDLKAGWNQFAYPVKETRPITDALASIDGCYSDVFTSEPGGEVLHYEVGQPDSVNTLTDLKFGQGYTIYMTKSCKLRLKGPVGAPNPAVSSASVGQPAAIYFGTVASGPGFTPAGRTAVLARVNGVVCGRGTTFERNGTIVYAVPVSAERPGAAGCGRPGQAVTFQVGSQVMGTVAQWDADRPRELVLQP
jgi:hypothetical protein